MSMGMAMKMMAKGCLAAAFLFLGVVESSIAATKPDKISVAYCTDCVQFQFRNKDAKADGLIIDIWRLWSKKTGIAVDFKPATWEETLKMVADGRADAHAGLFFNKERAKFLEYGAYLTKTDTKLFVNKNLSGVNSLDDLANYKIGVLAGDYVEGFLKKKLPPGNIVGFKSYDAMMEALREGNLRVFAADTPTGIFHLQKAGLGYVFEALAGKPLYTEKWFAATAKDDTELIKIINDGMALITPGERRDMERRWASVGNPGAVKAKTSGKRLELTDRERQWLAKHRTIRLGVGPNYPPFEFIAEDGTYSGMASDYARLVGERLGVTMKVVPGLSWGQVIRGVKNGAVDVLPAVTKTPARNKFMNFSRETMNFPDVIFMRDGHSLVAGLPDMKGRKVALVEGYATTKYVLKNYPTVRGLIVKSPLLALTAVADGKADATVQNLGVATYLVRKHDLTNLVVAAPAEMNMPGLSFGVRKDWPELAPIIDKVLASVKPEEEAAIRKKWGSTQYQIGINIATVRRVAIQVGGVVIAIVIVIVIWNRRLRREVKNRKRAEAALGQKTDILQAVLGSMAQGVVAFDKELKLITWNDNFVKVRGYPESLMSEGRAFAEFMQYDADVREFGLDDPELNAQQQIDRARKFLPHEFERRRPNGRYIEVRGGPIPGGGFVSTFSDITERKRREEELRKLSSAVESSPNSVAITDLDANIIYVNPKFEEVSGYTFKELVDHKPSLLKSGNTPPETYRELWETISAGKIWRGDLLNKKKNGELFWEYTSIAPVKDEDGHITHYVAVKVDVTELKEAKEAADAANKAKSEFLANISHELRTPLNAIIGYSEMLIEAAEDDTLEDPVPDLEKIKDSGKHLHTMINEILDLAKIEAGKMDIFIEEFAVAELVGEVQAVVEPMVSKKNNRLEIIHQADGVTMVSDQTKVRQILFNLLGNAAKFTENGDITLTVGGFRRKRKNWLKFTISDTGIGMNRDQVDRLFEAFTQADASTTRNYGGTGLGLTITKHFCEMLGGDIDVESREGKGTTFILTLPAKLK